ncbi:MAG: DUF4199 domain-containing protein [Bacteroidota bacterium]|nr:DUF4199 domain-containing protein [Bacteroidota bacterium]
MEKPITTPATKGITISLIIIVQALVLYFMDIDLNSPVKYIGYLILIAGVIWSVISYGKELNNNATFGSYFAHGFKVTAIITCIMIVFMIIFILLFPEIREKGMETARQKMVEKGNMSDEQITQAINFAKKFFMVFIIAGTLIGYLIIGAIASLIGAGVTKKDPRPEGEFNQIG